MAYCFPPRVFHGASQNTSEQHQNSQDGKKDKQPEFPQDTNQPSGKYEYFLFCFKAYAVKNENGRDQLVAEFCSRATQPLHSSVC